MAKDNGWYVGSRNDVATLFVSEGSFYTLGKVGREPWLSDKMKDRLMSAFPEAKTCRYCHQWISYIYNGGMEYADNNLCWQCNLWTRRATHQSYNQFVTEEWEFYTVGSQTRPHHQNGFGGRWYKVIVDEVEYDTCDLWYGGVIPLSVRHLFIANGYVEAAETVPENPNFMVFVKGKSAHPLIDRK